MLSVFFNLKKDDTISIFDQEVKKTYSIICGWFEREWIGFGWYDNRKLVGYCFIKYPNARPETLTQVHEDFRNKGIASALRNYAIQQRDLFLGNTIYSASHLTNSASIKSLIKSGYQVFDLTQDGHLQFIKILPYAVDHE